MILFHLDKICRYCNQAITDKPKPVIGYWSGTTHFAHEQCAKDGVAQEVIECQTIDADCNDCRHFKRGTLVKKLMSCMEDGKSSTRMVNLGYFTGHCLKFDRPTIAQPNKWSGYECFEHRKSPV